MFFFLGRFFRFERFLANLKIIQCRPEQCARATRWPYFMRLHALFLFPFQSRLYPITRSLLLPIETVSRVHSFRAQCQIAGIQRAQLASKQRVY